MKMTRSIIYLFALIAFSNLSAQSSSEKSSNVNCQRELSIFAQSAKAKKYDSAKPRYEKLIENCPDQHVAIYQYGARMWKHFIKETDDKAKKKAYAKKLITNYKNWLKYFPQKTDKASTQRKIAQLKVDNDIGTLQEQYDLFDKSWKSNPDAFTDPKAIYSYFSLLIDLQDKGEADLEDVFKKYDEVMGKINKDEAEKAKEEQALRDKKEGGEKLTKDEKRTMSNNKIYLKGYMQIKESIKAKIGSRADCENLIPLYTKDFDAHKDDADWLKIAAGRLSAKKCTKGDLFYKITKALNEIEPSAKSAKYLGQLAQDKGKTSEAIKYFKQSIDLEEDAIDKAKVNYMIANIYKNQGSFSQARSFYRKTLKNNPSYGRAYLKIAQMYSKSANDCGQDVFEKRAVYWLAEKYAKNAARVDPSLKSTAGQLAKSFAGRAPSKSDIFKAGKEGETITIKCWINEKVQVPSL